MTDRLGWVSVVLVGAAVGLLVAAVLTLVVIVLVPTDDDVASFKQNCAEAGGHIYAPDIVFCVTRDGRLIEVYP